MSDLISRKKVIDILEKEKNLKCGYDADIAIFSIEKGIKEMPTAYDVDKVVEDIMETYGCHDCEQADTMTCNECPVLEVLNDICEIVKQGGTYDDVCEWRSVIDGEFIQNTHTKRLYSNEPSMQNVYCNTCGKKIKIVGD